MMAPDSLDTTPKTFVCALYHFARFDDYQSFREPLLNLMEQHKIKGTLLLAREGINGTVAGTREAVEVLLKTIKSDPRFEEMKEKISYDSTEPFYRAKVKLKKEIVTMGVENIDPKNIVGTYVKPKEWNRLINDPEVTVIDTRNQYEVQIGSFKGAVNPATSTFREFPGYADQHLDPAKHKKIAMFCTGGIRCEKSTAYLKQKGFQEVYHLEGGILKYLEEVPEEESLWEGECFVFDGRVSVNHRLEKGRYDQCRACRMPLTEADQARKEYVPGVSCHHCFQKTSELQRQRFKEREKQVRLAEARGEAHLGGEAKVSQFMRKKLKKLKK